MNNQTLNWIVSIVFCMLTVASHGSVMRQDSGMTGSSERQDRSGASSEPSQTRGESELRRDDVRGMSGRRGANRWKNPSEAEIELFCKVAGDLVPGGQRSLIELRAKDPEAFKRAVSLRGRRIWNLVRLRESNPDLYALKIAEVAVQRQLDTLARDYRDAVSKGESEEASALRDQLEAMAVQHVDLEMRVRGEELAAMAEALEKLRQELLAAATDRASRVKELLERVTAPRAEGEDEMPGRGGLLREIVPPETLGSILGVEGTSGEPPVRTSATDR